MAEFPILHDEPTLDDLLHRQEQVRDLGDLIARCQPPQVFGVHGDWGSGKTSFLQQLQWYLSGDTLGDDPSKRTGGGKYAKKVTTVWFEAWRYQHDGAPIVALLQEIRSQLPWRSKTFREAGKLLEVSLRSALLSIEDLTKKIGIQASKIQETGERWERENLAVALPSHVIRQHLEDALSSLLGKKGDQRKAGRRLVVLIDDLDRCESSAAYALLEGIKIYLNLPSCIFVLGMNQKVIEDAIAQQIPSYQKNEDRGPRRRAREYLEKLCQNSVHLPVLTHTGELLSHYLQTEGTELEGHKAIRRVIEEYDCLPRNARRIKAFANLLRRQAKSIAKLLDDSDDRERDTRLLVLMNVVYRFHPEIYRLLETYSAEFFTKLRRWCRNPGEDGHHLLLHGLPTPEGATEAPAGSPTSEPPPDRELLFPDPSESHVFRAQKLVLDLGQVTKDEIHRHLVR